MSEERKADTRDPGVFDAFSKLPASGLFGKDATRVYVEQGADGRYHDKSCFAKFQFVRSDRVPLQSALDGYHDCFPGHFAPQRVGSWVSAPLSARTLINLREQLLRQLDALESPPKTAREAYQRIRHPFSFDRTVGSKRGSILLDEDYLLCCSLSWDRPYLERYAPLIKQHSSAIAALDKTDLLLRLSAEALGEHSSSSFSEASTLVYLSLGPHARPGFSLSSLLPPVGGAHEALRALFGVGRQKHFLLVPPELLPAISHVGPESCLSLDEAPSQETLENLEVLFEPSGYGPYSDLVTAYQAAKTL